MVPYPTRSDKPVFLRKYFSIVLYYLNLLKFHVGICMISIKYLNNVETKFYILGI